MTTCIKVAGFETEKSRCETSDDISHIHEKAGREISVLARLTPYKSISKKGIQINALFTYQFNYYLWFEYGIVASITEK